MAAYAALLSLKHTTLHQIQNHPHPPIRLDPDSVRSLTDNVAFFQNFLENYSSRDADHAFDSRVADAAYEAEDIIESHIVDRFQAHKDDMSSNENSLHQGLQKVIHDLNLIETDVMEMKERMAKIELQQNRTSPASSLRSSPNLGKKKTKKKNLVGFNRVLVESMDRLTNSGQRLAHRIMTIVGMGGSGKTPLARLIYENPLVVQHFDVLVWVTISQEYSYTEILKQSLVCLKNTKEGVNEKSEIELGELLYKSLSGRSYLVVMDDLWHVEAWDSVKFFFPDNSNASRIEITT